MLAMAKHFNLTAIRVATKDDGTYRVDPEGRLAALIPVRDRWGEIVDAVAFFPEQSEQWWLRYGDEMPILGRLKSMAQARQSFWPTLQPATAASGPASRPQP